MPAFKSPRQENKIPDSTFEPNFFYKKTFFVHLCYSLSIEPIMPIKVTTVHYSNHCLTPISFSVRSMMFLHLITHLYQTSVLISLDFRGTFSEQNRLMSLNLSGTPTAQASTQLYNSARTDFISLMNRQSPIFFVCMISLHSLLAIQLICFYVVLY